MIGRVRILVLNFNGRHLLAECLPSVIDCARYASTPCQVSVIDNDSTDGSAAFVRERWPDVEIVHAANRGLVSFNEFVARTSEPVAILLNNDVKLAPGCVDRLVEPFERYVDCFLAGPLCWTFDGRYEGTLSDLCFRRGLVHTRLRSPFAGDEATEQRQSRQSAPPQATERKRPDAATSYTASAGAVLAVHREKFLALGGFDPLFLPGRYEDLDLAFRGWLAGWTAYFVPAAEAYHKGSATFGPQLGAACARLDVRNSLLFAWKNLREPQHVAVHFASLALRAMRALAIGQTAFLGGVRDALRMVAEVRRRRADAGPRVRSESELFRLLSRGRT